MTRLRWETSAPDAVAILTTDGAELGRYSWGAERNHPYVHPVRPLSGAGILTNHAPWDHQWHHGLWWSWKLINGTLFWEDEAFGGKHEGLGRSVAGKPEITTDHDGVLRLHQTLDWKVNDTGQSLLTEDRLLTIQIGPDPVDRSWSIDWDMTWVAATDVRFTTTPASKFAHGGYAGLNFRPARSLRDQEQVIASDHREGVADIHRQPVSWIAYTGCLDGVKSDAPRPHAHGGVAILVHAENLRHPSPAYTSSALERRFGFLAAAPLLHEDLSMSAGDQLRLRYRTLVLAERPDHVDLEKAYNSYMTA